MSTSIRALPAKLNIRIYRGDDFAVRFTAEDADGATIDVSGYSFAAQIRDIDTDDLLESFTFDLTDGADGVFIMELGRADTDGLPDVANWDMQVTAGDERRTWYAGVVTAAGDITEV